MPFSQVVNRATTQRCCFFLYRSSVRHYGIRAKREEKFQTQQVERPEQTIQVSNSENDSASSRSVTNSGVSWSMSNNQSLESTKKNPHFGINGYIQRVSNTANLGILGTLGVGTACSQLLPMEMLLPTMFGGFIASFFCVYWIDATKKFVTVKNTTYGLRSVQPNNRILAFAGLVGSMGLATSVLMEEMIKIDPSIPPIALGLTVATLGATNLYTRFRPISDKTFATMEIAVSTGIVASIAVGFSEIIIYPFYPEIAQTLNNIDIYLGIPFWAFTSAYTLAAARRSYIAGKPDYIGEAAQLYLDGLNLLLRIMEALAKSKAKK